MQDTEKSEIYNQAMLLAEENTEESLEKAMQFFLSIKGWQDADRQYVSCRTRLGRMQWQRESARLKEYEDHHEAQLARRRKTVIISLVSILLIFTLIATVTMVRFTRYNRAEAYYTAAQYEQAADAFMKMPDYRDSKAGVYKSAVELYRLRMYDKALPYFVWLDGYMDHGYYLRKCQEKLGLEP